MAAKLNALFVVGLLIYLASAASGTPGTATFYTPSTTSDCFGPQPQGNLVAAASDAIYNNGAACGKMYKVTCTGPTNACTGNSVTVKIVEECPSPCQATLDLSQQAFSAIAASGFGKINIDYVPA